MGENPWKTGVQKICDGENYANKYGSINVVDAQTNEVGVTVAKLNVGPGSDV
jgi:hypothetical protein